MNTKKENLIIISDESMVDQLNTSATNDNGGNGSGSGCGSGSGSSSGSGSENDANTHPISGHKIEYIDIDLGGKFGKQTITCIYVFTGTATTIEGSSGNSSNDTSYTFDYNNSLIMATLAGSRKTETIKDNDGNDVIMLYLCLGGSGQFKFDAPWLPNDADFKITFPTRLETYENNIKKSEENIEIEVKGTVTAHVTNETIEISTKFVQAKKKEETK